MTALRLDEVQHGIAAAGSEEAIQFLKDREIRLNLTPSSNRSHILGQNIPILSFFGSTEKRCGKAVGRTGACKCY